MIGLRRAFYLCKRTGTVTIGGAYYTKVTTLCGRQVEVEKSTEVDDRVTCPECLNTLCLELKKKAERICAKIDPGDS